MIDLKNMPDEIRTHGLCLRRATLYPAELQAHYVYILAQKLCCNFFTAFCGLVFKLSVP